MVYKRKIHLEQQWIEFDILSFWLHLQIELIDFE